MIEIKNLGLNLPGFALKDINLSIGEGEFFALIGPTGSGKSLLLETLAGIMTPTSGHIFHNGRDITHLSPERRRFGLVYQDHALFPHLTVEQNIRFGFRYLKKDVGDKNGIVGSLARTLGIDHLLGRRIQSLSGGELQRTAMARALAVKPDVLLLDEPMSALDPAFRHDIQKMLSTMHQETGITFVMVTHSFDDVFYLAQSAALIRKGEIVQTGPIGELFNRPQNSFAAGFVGMKNIFPARWENGKVLVDDAFSLDSAAGEGEMSHVAFRPEEVVVETRQPENSGNLFSATIAKIAPEGFHVCLDMDCQGRTIHVFMLKRQVADLGLEQGREVYWSIPPGSVHIF